MADNETGPPCPALSPNRSRRRHEVRDRFVIAAEPVSDLHKSIVGVHPLRPRTGRADRLPFEKGQYLPSFLVPAQWLWRPSEPGSGEMREQEMHRPSPRPHRAPNRPLDEFSAAIKTARKSLAIHGATLPDPHSDIRAYRRSGR